MHKRNAQCPHIGNLQTQQFYIYHVYAGFCVMSGSLILNVPNVLFRVILVFCWTYRTDSIYQWSNTDGIGSTVQTVRHMCNQETQGLYIQQHLHRLICFTHTTKIHKMPHTIYMYICPILCVHMYSPPNFSCNSRTR